MSNTLTPMPYAEIARAALASAETLLFGWIGGKRSHNEWQADKTTQGGLGDSLTINLTTGKWMHGSHDKDGGDLISFYAYLEGIEQWQAAIDVADQISFNLPEGCRPKTKKTTERKKPVIDHATVKEAKTIEESPWHPVIPVPSNAGEVPLAHPVRGLPAMKWEYKDANGQTLGYVYRFNKSDGSKETLPLTWCINDKTKRHEWRWMIWTAPKRPLYGLDRLASNPDAWVLLVSGEKCADAPVDMIEGVVVTWPGGDKAVDKIDWKPLAGRKIYSWADCDAHREKLTKAEKEAGIEPESKPLLAEDLQSGMRAMLAIREKLLAIDAATDFSVVEIPKPLEKPSGWDVADAIDEGMTSAALLNFILKSRPQLTAVPSNVVELPKSSKSKSRASSADAKTEDDTDIPKWRRYLLTKNSGEIVACLSNIYDILENDERWQGVIVYDDFGQRVMKLKSPPYWNNQGSTGEWDAQDDANTAIWITKLYRFSPSASMVAEAIESVARTNRVNPPKDWLNSLVWDDTKRVDRWMLDYMGVPMTEYSKRVARWFFMGMVKRVFEPGCKFDYCLVLEGTQGRKKSSALAAIGGEWYGDTDLDLHNKDSMSALRGKMLYEFSELGSVAKAEATKQKSFLSRQVDEYRPVYGRREIRAPRQLVFSGTTNEWEWNKDPTGGRRFWPVSVNEEIDVDGLKTIREQLFAEAVVMVNEGLKFWPTSKEQAEIFDPEQLSRSIRDSYIDALFEFVNTATVEFTLNYALSDWLKIPIQNQSRDIQTRVGNALRDLGCKRIERRSNATARFFYKPPENQQPSGFDNTTNNHSGDEDDQITF